jgi:hypothetical protein
MERLSNQVTSQQAGDLIAYLSRPITAGREFLGIY